MPSKNSPKARIECLLAWLKQHNLPKPEKKDNSIEAPKIDKAWSRN